MPLTKPTVKKIYLVTMYDEDQLYSIIIEVGSFNAVFSAALSMCDFEAYSETRVLKMKAFDISGYMIPIDELVNSFSDKDVRGGVHTPKVYLQKATDRMLATVNMMLVKPRKLTVTLTPGSEYD